ncbi:MAG: VOC family protein [Shewanella sp.]
MFSHIMLGANDIKLSKKFYDAVFATLGYGAGHIDDKGRCVYRNDNGVFAVTKPINGEKACHGNGSTIGFSATSVEAVHAWHAAGVANGGSSCEEPPGMRETPFGPLCLAYLRDPDGNKLCALYRQG